PAERCLCAPPRRMGREQARMVLPLGDIERTRIVPVVNYALIAMNVVMYLVELDRGQTFQTAYAATPYEITHNTDIAEPFTLPEHREAGPLRVLEEERQNLVIPQGPVGIPIWMTLFTAMFLHGSPMHLAGNMLYLWIFGDNVEEVLGRARYVAVY